MKKTVLCFGDSNTWGYIPGGDCERYGEDTRWPGVMQATLGRDDFCVIEEAQNGRMSAWDDPYESAVGISKNGSAHLPIVLESHKPLNLVIVMLGTNDLKDIMNHDARTIAQAMGVLIDIIADSDAGPGKTAPEILIICPVPVTEGPCPFESLSDRAAPISRDMAAAYQEICERRGVHFLNAGDFAACPTTDCIHIDEQGHAALGKAVAEKVRGIYS